MTVVVLDIAVKIFQRNKILDEAFARDFPGASLWPCMRSILERKGHQMMTADVFLDSTRRQRSACMFTDGHTPFTRTLLARKVRGGILFSGESPNVIPWFYHKLRSYVMDYRDAYLFRGFASRAGTSARFHSLCWPNRYAEIRETRSWKERALLTMVAGNKNRGFFGSKRSIKAFVRGAMDLAGWRYYQIIDELLRFPDYYKQRSAAIEHFAEERWFSLYGKGWDGVEWVSSPKGRRRFANRPHACKDKVQTMGGYKFNLCFENCAFPGYVTEKIFDSFFAGCVPVYFGAPDIEEFIPKECFIDYRAIGSFGELGRFLLEMAEREWLQKREAIVDFLSSSAYQRYRQENIAEEMVACLLEEH